MAGMNWGDALYGGLEKVANIGMKTYDSYVDTTTKAEATKIKAQTTQGAQASNNMVNEYLAKASAYKNYIIVGAVALVGIFIAYKFILKR